MNLLYIILGFSGSFFGTLAFVKLWPFNKLEQKIQAIPGKVLESITGSVSNHKGKLAELVAYMDLKASYDRIIPLAGIVDFIVIEFPTENKPGKLLFIDIKNGKSARLSDDQKALKKIIESGNVGFLKMNVETESALTPDDSYSRSS